jgi:hypothetical protein
MSHSFCPVTDVKTVLHPPPKKHQKGATKRALIEVNKFNSKILHAKTVIKVISIRGREGLS